MRERILRFLSCSFVAVGFGTLTFSLAQTSFGTPTCLYAAPCSTAGTNPPPGWTCEQAVPANLTPSVADTGTPQRYQSAENDCAILYTPQGYPYGTCGTSKAVVNPACP